MKPVRSRNKKSLLSVIFIKLFGGLRAFIIFFLPYVFLLALVGLLCGGVAAYAVNSTTFQLRDVKVSNIGVLTPQESFAFCDLKPGENLITLDLIGIQQLIKKKHPEFKEVRVMRVLPSRVEVLLKRRTPVAQIAFSRFVQVDRYLVVLTGSSNEAFANLPIITGTPMPKNGVYVGTRIKDPITRRAIRLADIIIRSKLLGKHELSKVDIGDPKNISFYIDSDIEVRIGSAQYMERLRTLSETLRAVDLDKKKIRYIDLRFDDVVIGPR